MALGHAFQDDQYVISGKSVMAASSRKLAAEVALCLQAEGLPVKTTLQAKDLGVPAPAGAAMA